MKLLVGCALAAVLVSRLIAAPQEGTPPAQQPQPSTSLQPRSVESQTPHRITVAEDAMKALIVHKVPPKYPEDARNHRIQGTVLVDVIVGTNGKVTDTKLVFGHPALAKVTVDAIRKWKFKPYLLNGNPIEVETQVTMNFSLSGGVDQSSARVSINSSPE